MLTYVFEPMPVRKEAPTSFESFLLTEALARASSEGTVELVD